MGFRISGSQGLHLATRISRLCTCSLWDGPRLALVARSLASSQQPGTSVSQCLRTQRSSIRIWEQPSFGRPPSAAGRLQLEFCPAVVPKLGAMKSWRCFNQFGARLILFSGVQQPTAFYKCKSVQGLRGGGFQYFGKSFSRWCCGLPWVEAARTSLVSEARAYV